MSAAAEEAAWTYCQRRSA